MSSLYKELIRTGSVETDRTGKLYIPLTNKPNGNTGAQGKFKINLFIE